MQTKASEQIFRFTEDFAQMTCPDGTLVNFDPDVSRMLTLADDHGVNPSELVKIALHRALDTTPRWEGVELDAGSLLGEGPKVRTRRTGWANQELHEFKASETESDYFHVLRPIGPGGVWRGRPTVTKLTQLQATKTFLEWFASPAMTKSVMGAFQGDAKRIDEKGRPPRLEIRGGLARAIIGAAEGRGVTEEALLAELLMNDLRGGAR